jgi:hypothetical protein
MPIQAEPTRKPTNYAIPAMLAVLPIIYYRLRGKVTPKDRDILRVVVNPGTVQHVLFLRGGQPAAVATCTSVIPEPATGTWLVNYENLVWLKVE